MWTLLTLPVLPHPIDQVEKLTHWCILLVDYHLFRLSWSSEYRKATLDDQQSKGSKLKLQEVTNIVAYPEKVRFQMVLITLIYAKLKFFDRIHDHRIASALAGTFDGFE